MNELEDTAMETIQFMKQEKKTSPKWSISIICDNLRWPNIQVTGVLGEGQKKVTK